MYYSVDDEVKKHFKRVKTKRAIYSDIAHRIYRRLSQFCFNYFVLFCFVLIVIVMACTRPRIHFVAEGENEKDHNDDQQLKE